MRKEFTLKFIVKKYVYLFALSLLLSRVGYSQSTPFIDNFDDNILAGHWEFAHDTYEGEEKDSVLNVTYKRTANSWVWDQFNIRLPNLDISQNPFISLKIKSNLAFQLVLKPLNIREGSDWLEHDIPGDNEWHEYFFELVASKAYPISNVFIYFDAGSSLMKEGLVQIDDFKIGAEITIPLNFQLLEEAIRDANNLHHFTKEGEQVGAVPQGLKDKFLLDIIVFQEYLNQKDQFTDQFSIDSLAYRLYDLCTAFEQEIISDFTYLTVDPEPVYGVKNLYNNLHELKGPRFLYGMQDATGYGVNWNGDDDRCDVKDVTGSYPAVFNWDINAIPRKQGLKRFTYRIENAHTLGGVTSFCWHQFDPEGVSFYSDEISQPQRVVSSLLPGGVNNAFYQEKMQQIGNYFKTLRSEKGLSIPILFRPYHEHNGWWFWWGSNTTSTDDFIELWHYTVSFLRDELNVHNLIYVFSPDGQQIKNTTPYLYRYPGDDFVDVLGLDFYFGNGTSLEIDRFAEHIKTAVELADQKNKVAAITEVGDRKDWDDDDALEIYKWHTRAILEPIKASPATSKIAYLSTWRNANINHHFAPYPGHQSVPDFLAFYGDTTTIFLNNMVKGITDSLYYEQINVLSDAAHLYKYVVGSLGGYFQNQELVLSGVLNFNYTNALAAFEQSMNATVTLNENIQLSGKNRVDLSEPLIYKVTSENQKVTREYLIRLDLLTSTETIELPSTEIDIYPLPAKDYINVATNKKIEALQVFESSGRLVAPTLNLNPLFVKIDFSSLPPGQYTISLLFSDGEIQSRLVVLH